MRAAPKLALVLVAAALVAADDPIDSVMYRSPELPKPTPTKTHHPRFAPLLVGALDRPDADTRTRAALTIAQAHEWGTPGLVAAGPALARELARAGDPPAVALAAAGALVALDARDRAPELLAFARRAGSDARELVEPALARWKYAPAADDWLQRLAAPAPSGRGAVLAARGLAALGEARAVPRLRELVLAADTEAGFRAEAAAALGAMRTAGGEPDAAALARTDSPVEWLCAARVLRAHGGPAAVRALQQLAAGPHPVAAAVALPRLLELDAAHVVPVLPAVLASPDASVRGFGVECLRRRPSEAHVKLLGARLADHHPDVRAAARVALRERAATLRPAVLDAIDATLAGTDWRALEQAAVLAGELRYEGAAQRLVGQLEASRAEPGVAAAWALRVLAVPDTLAPAFEHFKRHLKPGEPPPGRDRRLAQLAQFFGARGYAAADRTLRDLIPPKAPAGVETRAAACWALGLLNEGKGAGAGLTRAFVGRLNAVTPFDMEDPGVRSMCAISLGRVGAKEALPELRKYFLDGKWTLSAVNNACGWAVEQLTGERFPPAGTFERPRPLWFLVPVE